MKKKHLETLLYSIAGVGAMFLLIVAINFIASAVKVRADLTQEKAYTLSDGTKAILKGLEGPVEIRFYYSQGERELEPSLKIYAQRVEDLLNEYKQVAKGNIELKKFKPKPDSDAEDLAQLDGVEGQMSRTGDPVYLGLAISYLEQKISIPFLSPMREQSLEYDISRAISKVVSPEKPVVGIMTSLPMFGQPMNPMMMRMGQQPQEPWVVVSELQRDFTVKQLQMDVDKIDDDIKVLLVVHPKNISDKAQYAIDQFVLRGGKLIAFLDPLAIMDRSDPQQNPMMPNMGAGSSLDKLLKAWGLTFDTTKVIADRNFVTRFVQNGRPQEAPAVLSLNPAGINKDDVVTSQIDNLLVPFAGVFTGTPAEGLKKTVLLHSSPQSQMVEGFMAQMGADAIMKDFKASGTTNAVAIRLAGKFKTAFPDGKPADAKSEDDKEEKKDEAKSAESLKESKGENVVVLVGDADVLHDQFSVQVQNIFGQKIIIPRNGNLNLAQNVVEQMTGDSNLIGVRSRATLNRPFTVVQEMKANAEAAYQNKIKELNESLREAQTRLNELQAKKEKGQQRMILSKEQEEEVERFRKKEAEVKRELRSVEKQLARDRENLENTLKWANIAGMPFLVAVFGIVLAVVKNKRAAAK
jgi:gliding-associated putative ABC transporter substrate-binding component GldG